MPFTGSDICKVCHDVHDVVVASADDSARVDPVSLIFTRVSILLTWLLTRSFAIILPPVGVFLERGFGADLIINIVLVRMFPIPICAVDLTRIRFQTCLGYMYALVFVYTLLLLTPFSCAARVLSMHSTSS